jgi:hypothetical protein
MLETRNSIGGIPRVVARQIIKDAEALKSRVAKMNGATLGTEGENRSLPLTPKEEDPSGTFAEGTSSKTPMTWEQQREDTIAKERAFTVRKREIAADRRLAALDRADASPLMNSADYLRDQLDRVIAPQGGGWAQVSRGRVINEVLAEADQRSPIEKMLVGHILACSNGAMKML